MHIQGQTCGKLQQGTSCEILKMRQSKFCQHHLQWQIKEQDSRRCCVAIFCHGWHLYVVWPLPSLIVASELKCMLQQCSQLDTIPAEIEGHVALSTCMCCLCRIFSGVTTIPGEIEPGLVDR